MTPEGWKLETLGSLARVRRGASPRPIQDPKWFAETGPGWVRIADVTHSSRWLRRTEQYLSPLGVSKSVQVRAGDLIMSICATIGKPIIVDMDACIHDGFVLFGGLDGHVDRQFLYYFLQDKEAEFSGQGQPGTQKNLNSSIVADMPIALPPLPEQRRIAAILSSVDDAIEASQAVIDQLQVVKKAMMAELLTKGLPGRHKKFKQTEVGVVPEEWDVSSVGSLASFVTSGSRGWAEYYAVEGALFIRSQNVRAGVLDLSDKAFVRVPAGAEGERTRVVASDVLITITGNSVGNVAEAPPGLGDAYVSQHVGLVRLKNPLDAAFLAMYLSPGAPGNAQILAAQYGQSKPGLSLANVRSFSIPIPAVSEMCAIRAAVASVEERIAREEVALENIGVVKQSVMSVLLTGEVRVRVDEEAAA